MDLTEVQISAISQWAERNAFILAVRLYGSRYKRTSMPDSDVDLAVTIAPIGRGRQTQSPYTTFHFGRDEWKAELEAVTGLRFHIEMYEPKVMPNVFGYVSAGHALIYEKAEQTAHS